NNCNYGRFRFTDQYPHTRKEQSITRHRVVHSGCSEHALAEETESRNCDRERDPASAPFAECDAHKIRSRRCGHTESNRAEYTQTRQIYRKIERYYSSHA